MKAIEQYFLVVVFDLLYSLALSFVSLDETLKYARSKDEKAIEQYFPVVLFVSLYSVVLTFKSVDETLKSDHSNESY